MLCIGIIDDHQLFTDGLSSALRIKDGVEAVWVLNNPAIASQWLDEHSMQVIILDVMMPEVSGLYLIPIVLEKGKKVLVVTSRADREMMRECLAAGAHGFCSKNTPVVELLAGLRQLLKGERYLCSNIRRFVEEEPAAPQLTEREKEVAQLLAQGLSSREIGEKLFVSENTVNTHRKRMLRKFGCTSTAALVRHLVLAGISFHD